jgi:hypothetical protein
LCLIFDKYFVFFFRTILYVSMIYALGNISMAVTAIPYGGEYLS